MSFFTDVLAAVEKERLATQKANGTPQAATGATSQKKRDTNGKTICNSL